MNIATQPEAYVVGLATSEAEKTESFGLRYRVFASEFGADGDSFNHNARIEHGLFDTVADHLILKDTTRPEGAQIVGTSRLMQTDMATQVGGFSAASEYDLSPILSATSSPLEMSRTCLHPDYRGGTALLHLWQGLAGYVADHDVEVVFGVASFLGKQAADHKSALALLHQRHLAPAHLRPSAIGGDAVPSQDYATQAFDRRSAMIAIPSLIKAYLRMGGVVGDGAFVDHAFGSTDVCMILETAQLTARQKAFLGAEPNG